MITVKVKRVIELPEEAGLRMVDYTTNINATIEQAREYLLTGEQYVWLDLNSGKGCRAMNVAVEEIPKPVPEPQEPNTDETRSVQVIINTTSPAFKQDFEGELRKALEQAQVNLKAVQCGEGNGLGGILITDSQEQVTGLIKALPNEQEY